MDFSKLARAGFSAAFAAALFASQGTALAAPVEVTRFHTPESLAKLDRSEVAVVDAPVVEGALTGPLEKEVWRAAVAQALAANGFPHDAAGTSGKVAEVRVEQRRWKPERQRGGVSVGVGGSTGSYGSGVGLGIGINLGGGSKELQATTLSVTIRDKASGQALWEGRAEQTVKASSADARADRSAERMAQALFSGFPGKAGETIPVK